MSSLTDHLGNIVTRPRHPTATREAPNVRRELTSPLLITFQNLVHNQAAVLGLAIICVMFVCCLLAEFVAPYNPNEYREKWILVPPQKWRFIDVDGNFSLRPFVHPYIRTRDFGSWDYVYEEDRSQRQFIMFCVKGSNYKFLGIDYLQCDIHLFGVTDGFFSILGTDTKGRDLLSRTIFGARISIAIPLLGAAIAFLLGIVIGGVSGSSPAQVDTIIQKITGGIRSFPMFPLWMALSVLLPAHCPPSRRFLFMTLILSTTGWTDIARVVRGKIMSVKKMDFLIAAKLDGASNTRLVLRYLFPATISYVITRLVLVVPQMMMGETALGYIGLGMKDPAISWGIILKEARHLRMMSEGPWLLIPAFFVFMCILAFSLVGDAVRDAVDPHTSLPTIRHRLVPRAVATPTNRIRL